jgi:hypothetical protein
MLRRVPVVAAVWALAVVMAACDIRVNIDNKLFDSYLIQNRTSEALVVFIDGLSAGNGYRRRELAAGRSEDLHVETCLGIGAVATDMAGREIARLSGPLCPGGVWAFEADGTVVAYSNTAPGQLMVVPTPVPPSERPPYPGWWKPSPSPGVSD